MNENLKTELPKLAFDEIPTPSEERLKNIAV